MNSCAMTASEATGARAGSTDSPRVRVRSFPGAGNQGARIGTGNEDAQIRGRGTGARRRPLSGVVGGRLDLVDEVAGSTS